MRFWPRVGIIGKILRNMEPPKPISLTQKTCGASCLCFQAAFLPTALYLLAACASVPPVQKPGSPVAAAVTVTATPPQPTAKPELSPGDPAIRDHIQNATSALQTGQEANAKTELNIVLRQEPENKVARSLLAQIQTDPATYFGSMESFNYILQPGDTLASLAQRFLNESLKFHILARFNGIKDPSRLAPGVTIKIPGKKASNAAAAPAAVTSEEASRAVPARGGDDSRIQRARGFFNAGKYQQAIQALEGSGAGNNEARDLLGLSYSKYADELAQNKNLIDAQSVLENALAVQPGNDKLRKQLRQIQKQREVMKFYKAGTDAQAAGDNDKALEAFNAVLKLDPAHEEAKKQIATINADNVDALHKEAMVEYGKQNLDKAIALWERVLAISPEHASAKLYRARAVDLKSRMQKLEQKPAAGESE